MHPELEQLIARIQSGEPIDARQTQRDLSALWELMTTERDRVNFLEVHRIVMDLFERTGGLAPDDLSRLKGAREAEYRLFLTREAMSAEGNVDPNELDRITRREVEAGRMSANSDFRQLAADAGLVLGRPPGSNRPRSGFLWPSKANQNPGVLTRIGRVLHWIATGLAALFALLAVGVVTNGDPLAQNTFGIVLSLIWAAGFFLAGRGLRYILSGE